METHPQAHRLGRKIHSHSNAPWGRKIRSGPAVGIFSDQARCHRIRRPVGYKILLEVLARGKYQTVVEVPYVFEERKKGQSKLGPKQWLDYFIHLWRLFRECGTI